MATVITPVSESTAVSFSETGTKVKPFDRSQKISGSEKIKDIGDLEKKIGPEMFQKFMQGVGLTTLKQISSHQKRALKALKAARQA